jgi:hypothetical protein
MAAVLALLYLQKQSLAVSYAKPIYLMTSVGLSLILFGHFSQS